MSLLSQSEIEPRQEHYKTITHSTTATGSASGVAIAANVNRRYLRIQNDDATDPAYIMIGATAVANQGIKLVAGGVFVMSKEEGNLSTVVVNCIQGNSAEVLLIAEGVNLVS
jgi:hypothetical protein|tara:strand:+ start:1806 stop:2141 length:336 start_codon:yes stop_codon:yes gene_type:complete